MCGKQNRKLTHEFNLFDVSYLIPSNITPRFDSLLQQDASLRASFESQLILGTSYTLTYNDEQGATKKSSTKAIFNIDGSGNTAGLLLSANPSNNGDKTIFNRPVAQYIKLSAEVTNLWNFTRRMAWANRIIGGYGFAYGNFNTLPFIKQFFIGGTNSVRAFRARTLGPGSFYDPNALSFATQAGDIKLEANSELRMKLAGIVNGAVFVDAGNIWLRKEDPTKPGSGLTSASKLLQDLAVGGGVGIRIDASIVVMRFDLAMPFRVPYLPASQRWVLNQINFGDAQWRKKNLILNIAIGYPF